MKSLEARSIQQIVDLLTPLMETEQERFALLVLTLVNHPLLGQLDLTGSSQSILPAIVERLYHFGKLDDGRPALWALLEVAREQVGLDQKHRIDSLRPAFELPPPPRLERVFVSYSHKNERDARRIVSDLKDAGLQVWYDREKIKGGDNWWQSVVRGITKADYFIFCLSPDAIRSQAARDEFLVARQHNKPIFAIMLEDCLAEISSFEEIRWLPRLHIIHFTQPESYGDSLRELIQSLPGYTPPDSYFIDQYDPRDLPNPFRGLEAFLEVDAAYFAGRENLVKHLLTRLQTPSEHRLLAVVGASGSGKSSLVRAGLIPALRQEYPFWETLTIKPGDNPLNEIADRLEERLGTNAGYMRERVRQQVSTLDSVVRELLKDKPNNARFVLVIDQFEEVFTLIAEPERQVFLGLLLYAINQTQGQLQIILTLRADFFDRLSSMPELARLVGENLDIITDLTAEQLRHSIEEPAHKVGTMYESGLVEQILEDVRSQPGSLPLLQYALKELFERKLGRLMTHEAYETIGGVKGALATRAEAIYTTLNHQQREVLRRSLLRLVEVDYDTITRRRVVRSDLNLRDISPHEVQEVLDQLTDAEARLLVASAPLDNNNSSSDREIFYEVSHEALLSHWSRLANWIAENREDLRRSGEILVLAKVWNDTERKEHSYLLTGGRLIAARDWLQRSDATDLQRDFILASISYEAEEIARLERLTREADEATTRANTATSQAETAILESETASQRAKRNRTIAVVTGIIGTIVAISAAIFTSISVSEAQRQVVEIEGRAAIGETQIAAIPPTLTLVNEQVATAQGQANVANTQIADANAELAAIPPTLTQANQELGIAQQQVSLAETQVGNANNALTAVPPTLTQIGKLIQGGEARIESLRLASEAQNILNQPSGDVETAALLSIRALNIAYTTQAESTLMRADKRLSDSSFSTIALFEGHKHWLLGAKEMPDGRILTWNILDLRLWSPSGELLKILLEGQTNGGGSALVLTDGRILSWGWGGGLTLWSSTGERERRLQEAVSTALELSDNLILSVSQDGLYVWSLDGKLFRHLESSINYSIGVRKLRDSGILFYSDDGVLQIWDYRDGTLKELISDATMVKDVLELRDGRILSWSEDGKVYLWTEDGQAIRAVEGNISEITHALELSDGRIITWSKYPGTVQLWSNDGEPLKTFTGLPVQGMLEISDRRLLSWNLDGTLTLWVVDVDLVPLKTLTGHIGSIEGALQLSNGEILSWGEDSTLRLWSDQGELLQILTGHEDSVIGVLELSNGHILSWGLTDLMVRLWGADTANIETNRVLKEHTQGVSGALELSDHRILSWSWDNTLRLWSTDGKHLRVLEGHTSWIWGALELADGRILSWSDDKTLRLWSANGDLIRVLEGHISTDLKALELSNGNILSWSRNSTLRSDSADSTLMLWSPAGDLLKILEGHISTTNLEGALGLSSGYILSWGEDKTLRLWSDKGDIIKIMRGHTDTVWYAVELSNGNILSWGSDGALLWSAEGESLSDLEGFSKLISRVIELRDGRILVVGSDDRLLIWSARGEQALEGYEGDRWVLELSDGRILTWNERSIRLRDKDGKVLRVLEGRTIDIMGGLEIADGRILLWSRDNTLQIWSKDGDALRILEGHTDHVYSALELSNGQLLSWSNDGTLRLWNENYQDFVAYVCTRVFRDFEVDPYNLIDERKLYGITDTEPTCPQFADT